MTDKAKIRAEIEKRYSENKADGYSDVCKELWDILSFIDSMQEEPVSNPIDFEKELYKAFGQVKDFTLGVRIAKRFYDMGKKSREPVSEELEEEIIRYVGYPQEVDEDISTTMIRKAARHFAKWQKTKDESTTEDLGEYINELSKQFPEVSFAKLSRIAKMFYLLGWHYAMCNTHQDWTILDQEKAKARNIEAIETYKGTMLLVDTAFIPDNMTGEEYVKWLQSEGVVECVTFKEGEYNERTNT